MSVVAQRVCPSLNPPQREAVIHGTGPLLVLAGAGSGKTRVITHRLAYLLRCGVPARALAAVTFTNKAAGEMRERVAGLVDDAGAAGELTISTFHSLGLSILKHERKALGYPRGFAIYDASDQLGVIRELLRRLRIGDRRYDVKAIATRISLAKNAFVGPDEYQCAEGDDYDEVTAELYPKYQRALRAFAAVDFDDLITETVRLLDRDDEVRARWRARFRHVLVDEYQDTNRAQIRLIEHLVAEHGNLCAVGDDDQSIYGWRGADPTNILRFESMFSGARVVKLEQNYRSCTNILEAANSVIANNADRYGKQLWSRRSPRVPIVAVVTDTPEQEAVFVAQELIRLRESERHRWSDAAVLYRSNIQTRVLEEALRERQIPYTLSGGQQFYERKEVKDVIAYLRVALSPRDELALRRVINYPARGVGATTVEHLTHYAQLHRVSLWTAAERAADIEELRPAARNAVASFVHHVNQLRAGLAGAGVEAAVGRLVADIGMVEDLRAASPNLDAAQRRIDNVNGLVRAIARHAEARPGREALAEYLRLLSLNTQDDASDAESSGERVLLTTLHGAKGLEFPVVFVIGLEEELLPHARTLMPTAADVSDPDHVSDVSEERRLMYVGITRAQDRLYLTRSRVRIRNGRRQPRTPSRFLLEIPDELLEQRDIAAEEAEPVSTDDLRAFFRSFGD